MLVPMAHRRILRPWVHLVSSKLYGCNQGMQLSSQLIAPTKILEQDMNQTCELVIFNRTLLLNRPRL